MDKAVAEELIMQCVQKHLFTSFGLFGYLSVCSYAGNNRRAYAFHPSRVYENGNGFIPWITILIYRTLGAQVALHSRE